METSIACEEIEDFWIVVVMYCVWGKDTAIGQHISNTQTIWQLWAEDEKIFASKIYILWDMADLIPYLVLLNSPPGYIGWRNRNHGIDS